MNERIKELWTSVCQNEMPELDETCMTLSRQRKFAELIVQECISVIEVKMPEFTCKEEYDNLIRKAGRMDAINDIKEHFEIQE